MRSSRDSSSEKSSSIDNHGGQKWWKQADFLTKNSAFVHCTIVSGEQEKEWKVEQHIPSQDGGVEGPWAHLLSQGHQNQPFAEQPLMKKTEATRKDVQLKT